MKVNSGTDVLLFDGECELCSSLVRFLKRRLKLAESLVFIGQESEEGIALMSQKITGKKGDNRRSANSIVLSRGERDFTRSAAAIRCLLYLRSPWNWAFPLLWIIPYPLRDLAYMIVSRFRHHLGVRRMNNS